MTVGDRNVKKVRPKSSTTTRAVTHQSQAMRRRVVHPLDRRTRKKSFPLRSISLLVPLGVLLLVLATLLSHQTASRREQAQSDVHVQVVPSPHSALVSTNEALGERSSNASAADAEIRKVRDEFHRRYGAASDAIYLSAVKAFGSLSTTAERMLIAASHNRPFVMAFAGYSVTVGRGNHYEQSFPFGVKRILQPLLATTLNIDMTVRNSAIGGIPSFPYAFCFEHFLGNDADVISWDFSMNEGKSGAVLESYIRHAQQLPNQPMLIMLDNNRQRKSVLLSYTKNEWIHDAITVNMAKDVEAVSPILRASEQDRPDGFKHWDEFGAGKNCPGRGSWHPKRKEHEFIAWMISMHMVDALELALETRQRNPDWKIMYQQKQLALPKFGPVLQALAGNDEETNRFLYGHPSADGTHTMKRSSCRTNFLPATNPENVLPSIVVSGMSPGITSENIMDERSDDAYRQGWVLDVSKVERDTKVKVENCGGLGYVDMKIALYGIPESGVLKLWLPVAAESEKIYARKNEDISTNAEHWFSSIIICEANEKRGSKACKLDQDLDYMVGGALVTKPHMIHEAGEYLKRQTCVHVGIPSNARVTRLSDLSISESDRVRLAGPNASGGAVGVQVEISTKATVTRKDGACCISHVVWEQQ